MATLLLAAAGSAAGGLFGSFGALVGQGIGAIAGSFLDKALIGALTGPQKQKGPRLTSVDITASTEGAAITRVAGRSRIAGQMIWATRFDEQARTETTGGKGLGGGVKTTSYTYYANFAVGLCQGPVERVGRVWFDGQEADQTQITMRAYSGSETQDADSLIVAKEGAENAPAYRGLAYVVFERLDLTTLGNRMPVVTAEVYRSVGELEPLVKGVALIPGTTEFGYEPDEVTQKPSDGTYKAENRHTKVAASDLVASLDLLGDLAPNCGTISLVAAWFGDDERCGSCTIRPKVENASKVTRKGGANYPWVAAGLTRSTADLVSQVGGGPAFGGSPGDESLIDCIGELKGRGLAVMFYPFIEMDIASDNTLPDPYSDGAAGVGQAAYPWRGRVTCSPAAGYTGSPDKTATAGTQVDAFVGTATAADFAGSSGTTVVYSGPAEWSYRRFILHMAKICELAGGVDLFCIGSEMIGLTTVRDGASSYPFVAALQDLAAEVATMLPGARIGYAADWSEYHSHRPDDGSNDVFFNLDPLWADANIDFIGIDNYLPLADWRDGSEHLDYSAAGPTTIYDLEYLKGNVEGGEHYDWYYASAGDRDSQTRTIIADGAYGKPWVYRNKDVRGWWINAHYDRPGGVEDASPTAWAAEGKSVIFTEMGCPAVDKGANQPNVFVDPKSSESFLPHYSSGARDDAMQRAHLQAMIEYWEDTANNPASGVYAGRMIETATTCIWAWDARMVPSFPQDDVTWADAPNWDLGHWIYGRLGAAPARETIADLMDQYGFADYVAEPMGGVVDAVIIDRVMSARDVFEAIAPAYFAYAVESQGSIRFRSRLGAPVEAEIDLDGLVPLGGSGSGAAGPGEVADRFSKRRGQETELPQVVKLTYGEPTNDDQQGAAEARRLSGAVSSSRTLDISLPVIMPAERAGAVAGVVLHDAWASREAMEVTLPPSQIAIDAGDVIRIVHGVTDTFRIGDISDGEARHARAAREEASLYDAPVMPRRSRSPGSDGVIGQPEIIFLDGALLRDIDDDWPGYIAAFLSPWTGGIAFYRSPETSGFTLDQVLDTAARMGTLAFDFHSGPVWRWDNVNELYVDLFSGTLSSATDLQVLGGANAIAVENADGEWEIVQFQTAELVSAGRYKLTRLLRGQRGSEHAMADPVAAGARALVLDAALGQPGISPDDVSLPIVWRAGPSNRDMGDDSYVEESVTIEGKGRRPLSPVHVAGIIDASGDAAITWTRRTRIGGDDWSQVEVPLGEESEAYEVDVLDGSDNVVRTIAAATSSAGYTAAQQSADAIAPPFDIIVYQLSATYGRGTGERATIDG